MDNLNKFLKFDGNGAVDVDASCAEFRTALVEYAALQAADSESIAQGVAAVFAKYPNLKNINLPALCSFTAAEMGADPKSHAEIGERVANYVRSATSLYKIGKGRNGGVSRVTAETTETPAS